MKKIALIIATCTMLYGCTDYKSQVEILTKEKQDLTAEAAFKDSTIHQFVEGFNEIESNLQTIQQKQNIINSNTQNSELKTTSKIRITESIQAINALMDENRQKVADLNKKLKTYRGRVAEFQKMMTNLNDQIAAKDQELSQLNEQLLALNAKVDNLNVSVDTLTAQGFQKSGVIESQTVALRQAYYTTGTSKELVGKQVITKEGGFLGLGKSKELKPDFNSAAFTSIDITKTQRISIEAKDAELVTNHPSDSYTIERSENKDVKDLLITDPDKFWKSSKYLVVVVDK